MRADRDRGAADALGLVVLGPVMIGLATLVVWSGRSVDLRAQLRTAAEASAQAAALEVGHDAMAQAASATAEVMLRDRTSACASVRAVTASDGVVVQVVVSCAVDGAELPLGRTEAEQESGGPKVVTETAWATLDPFRAGRAQ